MFTKRNEFYNERHSKQSQYIYFESHFSRCWVSLMLQIFRWFQRRKLQQRAKSLSRRHQDRARPRPVLGVRKGLLKLPQCRETLWPCAPKAPRGDSLSHLRNNLQEPTIFTKPSQNGSRNLSKRRQSETSTKLLTNTHSSRILKIDNDDFVFQESQN